MADGPDEVTALRAEIDALRAQLKRAEARSAREVQIRDSNQHLQSALAAGSIVGT